MKTAPSTHKRDFYAWTQEQAALLRAGRMDALDTKNLVEEIESMGSSERREMSSRMRELLKHLLKWHYQAGRRSRSWQASIDKQRDGLDDVLRFNPSLKARLDETFREEYPRARRHALTDTGLRPELIPETCPWTLEQVMDLDYLPE